jgi:hypothetical protein
MKSYQIYYSGILSNTGPSEMLMKHHRTRTAATLSASKGYPLPVGEVKVKNEKLSSLHKKPTLNVSYTDLSGKIKLFTLEKL